MSLLLLLLIWGALQSLAVTALTALLSSRGGKHRGWVLALYSFATHFGLMLESALRGPLWSVGGYGTVGLALWERLCCGRFTRAASPIEAAAKDLVKYS